MCERGERPVKYRSAWIFLSLCFCLALGVLAVGAKPAKNQALLAANRLSVDRKFAEAIEKYKQAIVIEPKNPDCYQMYGRTLALMGLAGEAIDQYKMALKLRANAELYNDLGVALVVNDNVAEGANSLKKAVELEPKYIGAYNNLGAALQKLGDYKQAYEAFLTSLKMQPTNPVIQKRLQMAKAKMASSKHFDFAAVSSPDSLINKVGSTPVITPDKLQPPVSKTTGTNSLPPVPSRAEFSGPNGISKSLPEEKAVTIPELNTPRTRNDLQAEPRLQDKLPALMPADETTRTALPEVPNSVSQPTKSTTDVDALSPAKLPQKGESADNQERAD